MRNSKRQIGIGRVFRAAILPAALAVLAACSGTEPVAVQPSPEPPVPEIRREFRAAWIATVANIDWPSRPGLATARQKAELRALLDRAVAVGLNAVILQVRPAADALYPSEYEPWSEYLTGSMGVAPSPFYDPLEFAVDEAHRRGLELHAWFNPFRARHHTGTSPPSPDHVSIRHPELVRRYGELLWLDPGDARAREYTTQVVLDVVRRYDIDGVHMDDYFYPYEIEDSAGKLVDFPDDSTWARARESGVLSSKKDWRRSNIDRLVQRLSAEIKKEKPWVRFGISPFGIWRPGHPPQIEGFDAYDRIYADARKWILNGWVDYLSPQLYWPIDRRAQSYPVLLDWWMQQNPHDRHIWPGNYTSRVMARGSGQWLPSEVVEQIRVTRSRGEPSGNIHFSIKALLKDSSDVGRSLAEGPYVDPALVPGTTWLGGARPRRPILSADTLRSQLLLTMSLQDEEAWLWTVRMLEDNRWTTRIIPGWQQTLIFEADSSPQRIIVTAVSRLGLEGPAEQLDRVPNLPAGVGGM